jgi:long-chain acyl-CoA synthetase
MKVRTNKPQLYKDGSADVSPPASSAEGPVRRASITKDALVTQPFEGLDTAYDVLAYAARIHGTRKAVGWRDVISIHEEEKEVKKTIDGKEVTEKKKWKYFELSDYKYITYIELRDTVYTLARAFVDIGIARDDVFNVYAQTR